MWVFYVNRGQAIASFGTQDKNHAILEFFPANRAWQLTPLLGFRTLLKVFAGKKTIFYEPFQNGFTNLDFSLTNQMQITSYGLKIEEKNLSLGLETKIEYFTIPQDSYAALVRIVTLKNTGKSLKKIQLLDGLPQIVPFGTSNLFLKKLGRTIEAWMKVKNLDKSAAFYKLDVDPTDRPEVIHIPEGNFYLGFHYQKNIPQLLKPIVDPQCIFGPVTDFSCPRNFLAQKHFLYPKTQITESKTPSGFLLLNLELAANQEKQFFVLVGYMRSQEALNAAVNKITRPGYLLEKRQENQRIIAELQQDIATASSSPAFNLYAQQTYLDNILRGGYPLVFKTKSQNSVFYLYSRKHGDLERDYNKFHIQPTYFSQGNGNFRDTNQNRRCDIWFHPEIEQDNIITFFNLLQLDGFNPLVVKGVRFVLKDEANLKRVLQNLIPEERIAEIISFLNQPFTPGDFIGFLEEKRIPHKSPYDELLGLVMAQSTKIQEAVHGEGFWTDHWTYNLDLLEQYLDLYPEKLKEILFEKKVFTFYDNYVFVKPRQEKYILYHGQPRQLQAVTPDPGKKEMLKQRTAHPHAVRTDYGKGEIYQTTLINKLFCLLANKLASFDPFGVGIEMEADKPNWFDALNGLPALFGSSSCETFELKRLVLFILDSLPRADKEKVSLSAEIHNFLFALETLLKEYFQSNSPGKDYQYWDKSYSLKEEYRQNTRFGVSGKEQEITVAELIPLLKAALKKIERAITQAKPGQKALYSAYFFHEVKEYQNLQPPFIKPLKFTQLRLPLFLEGQMHALRLTQDKKQARSLYQATKRSLLYDKKLKMYKVTAPLLGMPEEIGRCRAFSAGWLENESIWLHMEYKYLLEILKSGLYAEFYADFKNVLICFQNPSRYGRSILENSSFLVSSAFADSGLHGNGFVARLSGSTAEFIQIWLIMNVGPKPFFLNKEKELNLKFSPVLAGWLFDRQGNYSFNFLGKILVTYHNPRRKNTFGKDAVKPKRIILQDKNALPLTIASDTIPPPYAQEVRSSQIRRIDVYLD